MKKYFISAAVVAAMGAGSIYGYRTMNPNDGLSDAQLANIEALSEPEIELPEITIRCSGSGRGDCYDERGPQIMCDDGFIYGECVFTGNQNDWCITPCSLKQNN